LVHCYHGPVSPDATYALGFGSLHDADDPWAAVSIPVCGRFVSLTARSTPASLVTVANLTFTVDGEIAQCHPLLAPFRVGDKCTVTVRAVGKETTLLDVRTELRYDLAGGC